MADDISPAELFSRLRVLRNLRDDDRVGLDFDGSLRVDHFTSIMDRVWRKVRMDNRSHTVHALHALVAQVCAAIDADTTRGHDAWAGACRDAAASMRTLARTYRRVPDDDVAAQIETVGLAFQHCAAAFPRPPVISDTFK
jgi:hypothetical protein